MTISGLALLDRNILIYSHEALSNIHAQSRPLLSTGITGDLPLCVCPQVLNEFCALVTDPRRVPKMILFLGRCCPSFLTP